MTSPSSKVEAEDEDEDEEEDEPPVVVMPVETVLAEVLLEVPPEAEAALPLTVEEEPPPVAADALSSLSTDRPLEAMEGPERGREGKKRWRDGEMMCVWSVSGVWKQFKLSYDDNTSYNSYVLSLCSHVCVCVTHVLSLYSCVCM